jgi:hypothetical protein
MLETRRRLLKPICTSCADYVDVYWLHLWDKFTPIEENDFKMLMIATLVAIPLLIGVGYSRPRSEDPCVQVGQSWSAVASRRGIKKQRGRENCERRLTFLLVDKPMQVL